MHYCGYEYLHLNKTADLQIINVDFDIVKPYYRLCCAGVIITVGHWVTPAQSLRWPINPGSVRPSSQSEIL